MKFAVHDTGIGIAPENQTHIFGDFSQAEGSTTRRFGGTGLGLSICRRIVHLMGGDIKIDSVLGVGSTFSFELTLPVADGASSVLSDSEPAMASPRTLVIDDNLVAGMLTLRMLQSLGWDAQWATNGMQALAIISAELEKSLDQFPFAAVYVDWQMPGMDGWKTIRKIQALAIKHQHAVPKFIMVTAGGRESLEQCTVEEQKLLCGFLEKPVTAGMLLEAYVLATQNKAGMRVTTKVRKGRRQLLGMRILVVEDNLINQQVAEELLSLEGAIVSLAANGQLGVDAVAAAAPQFDVVLMDIHMPVLDGYGATKAIREELGLKQLPIIAMTANAMSTDRVACLDAGMNEHVSKPFDIAKLVSVLIRFTGIQSGVDSAEEAVPDKAMPMTVPDVPGLDLNTALARMSGLRALYARTARDFCNVLDTVVPELLQCAENGTQRTALMRLHTLKGNAGTLGVDDLAAKAAALEEICKSDDWIARCSEGFKELALLCESAKSRLALAISNMDLLLKPVIVDTNESVDQSVVQTALRELAALAAVSDLQVLQRYSELRNNFANLPDGFCDQLEQALQGLSLDLVYDLCIGVLAELGSDAEMGIASDTLDI